MKRFTPSNLVRAIANLPRNRAYNYIESATSTKIEIVGVKDPEGPISIKRYNPQRGQSPGSAPKAGISTAMIRRVANAVRPGVPINLDRVLGGSYNTRSALEALLAHTPEFYYCYPGRIESSESSTEIKEGHKHIVWFPDEPHTPGVTQEKTLSKMVISEIPSVEAVYEAVVLPPGGLGGPSESALPPEIQRRHAQIQIALIEIGEQLGFRTWIASNDRSITYKGRRLAELTSVVARLEDEKILSAYAEAVNAALLIDCIWFRNSTFMPAVIEIEHTTGVTSGLTRMKNFQDRIPRFDTRWVIAAPDEDRDKVLRECKKPQFASLNANYFPYSAVDELYSLCQRRKIQGVNDNFLDCFMELPPN